MSLDDIRGDVSLVVAVVGHRELFDEDKVRAGISDFLVELKGKYAHTNVLVITGMAEGADCVAVEAANDLGIECVAVLPFEERSYFATFTTTQAAEYSRNLMKGKQKIVLPTLPENASADLAKDDAAQKRQFEALGAFLVEASQILLAVYDLNPTGLQGGTSDVIDFKLGKKPLPRLEECSGLNNAGVGPVHYVVATRKTHSGPPLPITTKAPDYPVYRIEATKESYEASYHLQDDFNRDVKRGNAEALHVKTSRKWLYPNIDQARGYHAGMDWAADRFSWADALAMHNQRISNRYWNAVFVCLAIGVAALVPSHTLHALQHNPLLEVTYYCAIFVALVLGYAEFKIGYRRRYEGYRALAEALRIQYFWLASGLKKMVSEFYLTGQTGELGWVRDTMSEVLLKSAEANALPRSYSMDQAGIAAALTWIRGQKEYYDHRAKKWERLASLFGTGSLMIFVGAFALQIGATLLFHADRHFHWKFEHVESIEEWTRSITSIFIGWSVLAGSYGELNSYAQLQRQYQSAHRAFSLAEELLKRDVEGIDATQREKAYQHARQVVEELGKAALHETGDWFIMHRERKLDLTLGT